MSSQNLTATLPTEEGFLRMPEEASSGFKNDSFVSYLAGLEGGSDCRRMEENHARGALTERLTVRLVKRPSKRTPMSVIDMLMKSEFRDLAATVRRGSCQLNCSTKAAIQLQ